MSGEQEFDPDLSFSNLFSLVVAIWMLPCLLFGGYCGLRCDHHGNEAEAVEPPDRTAFDSTTEHP